MGEEIAVWRDRLKMKLPKEWEWKKLGQIAECLDSKRVPVTKNLREKGTVPYYGANGIQGYVKEFIFDEELLLLAEDGGSWGKGQKCAYIIRGKSWVNNHAHVLRTKSFILIKLLETYLNRTDLNKYISGTTRGKLNQKQMNDIDIPVPSLSVQKRIVAILERAEKLKENREQTNEDTNTIIQNLFYEMFGDPKTNSKKWTLKKTEDLFDMKLGKMLSAKNYTGLNLKKYLRNVNVLWGKIELSDVKEMDFNEKEFELYALRKGDILVTEGGDVGRTAIFNGELKNCCYQNALHRLRAKSNLISAEYFVHFMKAAAITGLITRDSSKVTIAHFTAQQFRKFLVMLPPISLQNQFASIVEKIESLKRKQSDSSLDINILFNALMQKAFSGALVS